MIVPDPIGDTLTRIRNAYMRSYSSVTVMNSKLVRAVLQILKDNNYISNFEELETTPVSQVKVELRYTEDKKPAASKLVRISKPGLRKYVGYRNIPKVLNGFGISILSTPKGVLTNAQAKKEKVGGELLCTIY